MNRKPLFFAFLLTGLLLTLHLYALATFQYWHHRWIDIPMHILGGVGIGAFLLAFFNVRRVALYFACMFVIVLGWEVFEYLGKVSTGQPDYWFDSTTDMVNGLIGATITFLFAKKSVWR